VKTSTIRVCTVLLVLFGAVSVQAQSVSFAARREFAAGPFSTAVALGDFNGDGAPDLVVTNAAFGALPGNVSVLLGNGDGTYRPAMNLDAHMAPFAVRGRRLQWRWAPGYRCGQPAFQ